MKPKPFLKMFFMLLLANVAVAQEDFLEKIKKHDLSDAIHPDSINDMSSINISRAEPYGYIGDDYQRFQIHFTSFKKSKDNPLIYNLKGKTRVKGNICNFTGTLEIVSAEKDDFSMVDILDPADLPKYKAFSIISHLELFEDKSQKGSGKISGSMLTNLYFDEKGEPHYNALMVVADGYSNNQFTGTWTSYKTGLSKKCHWGDYRIPESGDLDGGAGEFMVNQKYRNKGWETYYDMYCCDPDLPKTKTARKKEAEKWWQ